MLGAMMNTTVPLRDPRPALLDVVALLTDRPDLGLGRGTVGTVVESLDDLTSLVEFTDESGRAQAIVPCRHRDLSIVADPGN
jgi:Domain of unknown function (DUF4926)